MCVVLQHILARETLRSPVASLWPWSFMGMDPTSHHQNVSPFYHSQEETSLASCPSIDQPCADWMRAIASADGSRPAFRLLDFEQGCRPCTTTKDASLDAFLPGLCPDPTQPSYSADLLTKFFRWTQLSSDLILL